MREQDLVELRKFVHSMQLKDVRKVLICSPSWQEVDMIRDIFPDAEIIRAEKSDWNLDDRCSQKVDLIIASNVFMCAQEPMKWIVNCEVGCRRLVVLDHIQAYRGGSEGETSPSTGDVMRYKFPDCCDGAGHAKFEGAFNMFEVPSLLEYRLFEYPSGCGIEGYEKTKMFVASFRGSLI